MILPASLIVKISPKPTSKIISGGTRESLHGEANMAWLSDRLLENGIICRADDRLDPVIQLSPPLIITKEEMDRVVGVLDDVIGNLEARV